MSKGIIGGADLEQLFERVKEQQAELEKMVYVEDDHIVINVHYEYNIALARCDTLEKILGWTDHLLEKTWMTPEVLRRFIRLAAKEHGLEIPNP